MSTPERGYLEVVYDEHEKPLTSYPGRMTHYLCNRYQIRIGQELLEIGCGRGEFLAGFGACGVKGYGVDRSPSAGKHSPDATLFVTDLAHEPLPFDDNRFDVVYSKSVIEHMHDPESMLREARRVLKPGGLILTMTPDWTIMHRIFYDDFTHCSPFTPKGLFDILRVQGFDHVEVERFRQLPILWGPTGRLLLPIAEATRLVAPRFLSPHSKWVRWCKEVMLLSSARAPGAFGSNP